jgi:hypothetical protein
MACPRVVGTFPFSIPVFAGGDMYLPLSPFTGITGGGEYSFATTVTRVTGNATVIPAVQMAAAVESAPGAWAVAVSNTSNAVGTVHTAYSLASVTDRYLARTGVMAKLSGGSTPGFIEGFVSVVLSTCATSAGQRRFEVPPGVSATVPVWLPLGRVPASGASKLRATFVLQSVADLAYLFWVRGVLDPDAPDAWVSLNDGTYTNFSPVAGNVAICVGDLSLSGVSPANFQFLDVMASLRMKSGGTLATGMGTVAATVSYT